jgi:cell wall assembly regulator SMI1
MSVASWNMIHDWLGRHHPDLMSRLHGPADAGALASLEAQTGFQLPEDFQQSYLIHDGSDEVSGPLVGLPLMSLSVIGRNWEMWASVAADDNADLDAECRSHPAGAVKLRYANRGWLPFAGDEQNFIAIDFDPGPNGTIGQVINTGRDDMMRHVIAPTFSAFLEFVAQQFAAGRVVRSEKHDRWLQLAGEGGDLLTGLRPLLGLPEAYDPEA